MKFFYLIIIFLSSLVIACKSNYDAPCRDKTVKNKTSFSQADIAVFPYSQTDTISFISNTNDTVLFLTQSLLNWDTYKPTTVKGNPDCPADLDAFENISVALVDSANNQLFSVSFSKSNDSGYCVVNGINFSVAIAQIGQSELGYMDSIQLNTRVFYKVTKVYSQTGDSILMNADNGLIYYNQLGKSYNQLKFNSK